MARPRMRLHHEPETTAQALFERARRLDQVAGFGYEMADFLTDLVPFLSALASSERSGREAALIEAVEELLEHMDDYGHIGGVDVLPLRDAVAAIRNLAGTKTNG